MKSYNENYRNWQEIELQSWDEKKFKFIRTKIQVKFTQDQKIIYSQNQVILRIEYMYDTCKTSEILSNIEQIINLYWHGKYEADKEIGKWLASWDGNILTDVCGYSKASKKPYTFKMDKKKDYGKKFLIDIGAKLKYSNLEIISNHQRVGNWTQLYKNNKIGSGQYNNLFKKKQKWIELSDNFYEYSQVIYIGEYSQGKKVGLWDILHRECNQENFKMIGGGFYDYQIIGDSIKIGRWIELSAKFAVYFSVFDIGQYNKNGKKFDRWDIMYKEDDQIIQIGGGSYDEQEGSSIKIGKWIELDDGFDNDFQVTQNGEYNLNGKKVGKWDIWLKKNYGFSKTQQIGGGIYDEVSSTKIGRWIELSDGFNDDFQVTYHGEYNMNGNKCGRWNVKAWEEQIGGGLYDEQQGSSRKIGKWIEVADTCFQVQQISYNGVYNRNGKKQGRWDTFFKIGDQFKQIIGGGLYDEQEGSSIKIGKWIELFDGFNLESQVTYVGEYNKKGLKIGIWNIMCKFDKFKQIGC